MKSRNTLECAMASAVLLLLSGCNGTSNGKPAPKPPSKVSLTLKQDYLYTQPVGAARLTATPPSTVTYSTPSAGSDCNIPTTATHTWIMETTADYVDLTM